MSSRKALTEKQRPDILIANRHACCICAESGGQIHHINGDPSDNTPENLAVLCLPHHDKATSLDIRVSKLEEGIKENKNRKIVN